MRPAMPSTIRSWSARHSCFISSQSRRAVSTSPLSSASIARSIVGRDIWASSSGVNQRSVVVMGARYFARMRALVTGAARGIGAAIAQRLRDDGFDVVTLDRAPGCDHQVDLRSDELPALDDID